MEEQMMKEVKLNKEKDNLNIEKPIEEKVEPVVEEKSDELIEDKKKLETAKSKGILSRVRNFFKRK